MANFRELNRAIKNQFPDLDVTVHRGAGYIYFSGEDGYNMDSIMAHPTSTDTTDALRLCVDEVQDYLKLRMGKL